MKNLYCNKLDAAVKACTKTLTNNQRHVGEDVGWHQHLGTNKIGIVATSIALLYYKMIGKPCREEKQCLSFLEKRQNQDGGWPYISNTNGESNVESTCWALQALKRYNEENTYDEILREGIDWIVSQHTFIEDNDSGWGFIKESVPRVYITALVLRTLVMLDRKDLQEFESAKQWLVNAQNEDGGWGELSDRGSSFFFTSYVIVSLLECGYQKTDGVIKKAKTWLEIQLREFDMEDASLLCYMEFIEKGVGEKRVRIPFFHYVLPYVIKACIRLDVDNRTIFKAITLLESRTQDGEIEHPMLENSKIKPIWALFDSVLSIKEFEGQFEKWNDLHEIILVYKWFWTFSKKNPLRFIVRYFDMVSRTMIMAAVFYGSFVLIKDNWNAVNEWFVGLKDSTTGGILISMIAAVVLSGLSWGLKKVNSWVNKLILEKA